MTDHLPRPIEPGEIREGDRVVAERTTESVVQRSEFTAFAVGDTYISPGGDACFRKDSYTWTLLARPTPSPAVGSRWRDPETEVRYIYAASGFYRVYDAPNGLSMDHDGWLGLHPNETSSAPIIARLQPIPDHGDGCSPWLWDAMTETAWVAAAGEGTVTHIQVAGIKTHAGYLEHNREDAELAADLRPYSERGQANG